MSKLEMSLGCRVRAQHSPRFEEMARWGDAGEFDAGCRVVSDGGRGWGGGSQSRWAIFPAADTTLGSFGTLPDVGETRCMDGKTSAGRALLSTPLEAFVGTETHAHEIVVAARAQP